MTRGLNVSPQKTTNYITPLILLQRINPLLTFQSFHRATDQAPRITPKEKMVRLNLEQWRKPSLVIQPRTLVRRCSMISFKWTVKLRKHFI
jgi:hypothetical protein